ncbi:MAG: hypothetical protein WAP51_02950 [Candidatus Sungiibacteriota bacterium]
MLEDLKLPRLPDVGKNSDMLEPEDVAAAAIAVHQLVRYTTRQYHERCMRESLTKQCVRHAKHLAEMQSAHIERVLWNGNVLIRHLFGHIPPKESK